MSEAPDVPCDAHSDSSKKEQNCYVSAFDEKTATPFALALSRLFPPGFNQKTLEAFFQYRTSAATIRNWRIGRRNPPVWAAQLVDQELDRLKQLVSAARIAEPGARGPENLRKMRAARLERRA